MKKTISIVLALCMICALCACGSASSAKKELTFGTGGESGTYYAFGTVISQQVSSKTDTKITAVSSGGSKANIEDIAAGAVQLGFSQSDVMAYAYNGERLFDAAVKDFSVVAALYMEQVQIVTTNPDIKTVADLKGKIVSVGAVGSGTYFNAMDVLGAYGLSESDINAQNLSFGDSADGLKDGKIDAAFIVAGAPTTAIVDLATGRDVYLVSMDDAHIDALIASSPYYSAATITADTYGLAEDCKTVAVGAIVLAKNDVSEGDVYNFLKATFDNLDELSASHAKGKELSLDFASSVTAVPYHAGAVKYFAENGITVK